MFLEKLEIQGFKSFANKNSLEFPGMLDKERRGITCIVGPNGSGKSNIADAVRWVLGEQSMKTLRGKKSEDVIFSGSDKKSKLGMAEVSLFLNNEDKRALIDYSQLILTRRLYRDGASDYLLNNARARLSDLQILLAKAKFGQRTYSVVGQGMVEGFLNTSLAERKEFFDEATGVKQFQIKRDEALNKLRLSHENLSQVGMLLIEIEPRLKSLTRQVNKLQKREELERELEEIQLAYYAKNWHEINDKFNGHNREYLEMEKVKIEKEKKLFLLNNKLSQMEMESESGREFSKLQNEITALRTEKDRLTAVLAKLDARLEIKLEAEGNFDLSWLNNKKGEIEKEIEKIKNELEGLEREEKAEKNKLDELMRDKNEINKKISVLNSDLFKNDSSTDNEKIKKINSKIKELLTVLTGVEKGEDINEIKIAVEKIKLELKNILGLSHGEKETASANMEGTRKELMRLAETQEKILNLISEKGQSFSAKTERVKLFKEKAGGLSRELENIKNKLKPSQNKIDGLEASEENKKIKLELLKIEEQIKEAGEKITNFGEKEEQKRTLLFELQKDAQNLQNEINNFNIRLNEIKISSTKYETKLEDLETEIRRVFGDLKKIKETKIGGEVNNEAVLNKIDGLKRQLDMIGGIDPEIEKEYIETKERFDFLDGQIKDLNEAINSLEKIIKELDITIKERFDKEFKIISEKFAEYFKILFNGGNAKIIKVLAHDGLGGEKSEEELDGAEDKKEIKEDVDLKRIKFLQKYNATGLAGVEIEATPPGKKIKTISMLSGGERALTAIALICAIISANPSPFVVLDEVDAALDEANSERLAKILDDLSHKTQFIIITHNRASMRRANILYGVTMQDDGASKLLSIKLDEAEKRVRS